MHSIRKYCRQSNEVPITYMLKFKVEKGSSLLLNIRCGNESKTSNIAKEQVDMVFALFSLRALMTAT